jgi:hypothetical protein
LTFTACDENKDLTTESVDKSGGYITKADLNELINKIGDRDLKLIELIKNNPVSKLKTASLQKTAMVSSEFYFDTDNIMSLKNDTNQAVYIIPAYKIANTRDNKIYSLSININVDFIDSKLNIVQLKEDGTQEYISINFEYSKTNSKSSKTKDIECYCTIFITGGVSQGTGWSFPESTVMVYSSCSGGGFDFGMGSGPNTGGTITIATVWASSGGGTNYGYTYNYTGQQVYIGLTKKFPFQYFNEFQRVAITTNPEISNVLLEFLDTDGNSQLNKDFVVSVINTIEEGTVTNYDQSLVLLNAYKNVKVALTIESKINGTLLNPYSKGIFQQVKNTTVCDITEVLAKLGANKSVYNTIIKSEVAPSGAPAQTVPNSPFNYTIYISTDYVGKTKLFIATTMFHEIIHAYFLSIVDDYKSNPNNNQNLYNLNSFPSLFQAYCDKKYPPAQGTSSDLHHLEMANYYVDAIARASQEFQTGIPVAAGASPQQIYNDLAWGGLIGTPVFDATYSIGNPNRQRILNRYAYEQNGTAIGAGTPNEQNPIGNPCN